jgi:hypothetical protein
MPQIDRVDSQKGMPAFGGPRRLDFGPSREHPAESHGREDHRHGDLFAEHRRGEATFAHVTQDSLAELDVVEVLSIRVECRFTEGAAIDVIEDLTGQLPTSEFAVVIDRGWREIQAVVTGILGHNVLCSTRQQWSRRWLTTSR